MRNLCLISTFYWLGACAGTGGEMITPADRSISPGNAVIVFSIQVANDTRFQQCFVFAGQSAVTANWFGRDVRERQSSLFAIEVPAADYEFFRFACVYNGLAVSTSDGPKLTLRDGEVRYLGRLVVSDTEYGSAPGYRRMPTAVRLAIEDQRDDDLRDLRELLPQFAGQQVGIDLVQSWGTPGMKTLRPYGQGLRVVTAPVAGGFEH